MENIISDKLLDFTRKMLLRQCKGADKHNYHFGVRFYSDELARKEVAKGIPVMQALRNLAEQDFKSL